MSWDDPLLGLFVEPDAGTLYRGTIGCVGLAREVALRKSPEKASPLKEMPAAPF